MFNSLLRFSCFTLLLTCLQFILRLFLHCWSFFYFDGGTCGVWDAVGCCRPWQSLSFLLVAVVWTVGDRPCWLLSFLLVMISCVACGHSCILFIIIVSFLFCPSKLLSSSSVNHLLLLYCPIDAAGSLFFRIKKRIYCFCSVRFFNWLLFLVVVLRWVGGWLYGSVLPTQIMSWWWGLQGSLDRGSS